MHEPEIRELFGKTCTTISEYQKGMESIVKDVQKISIRLKEMKLDDMSAEMDEIIDGFHGGIQNAGNIVDGLTERFRELEQFVQIIEDVEAKVEKFGRIKELLKDIENSLDNISGEIAAGFSSKGEMDQTEKKLGAFQAKAEDIQANGPRDTVHTIYKLDAMIEAMEKRVAHNKKLLACITEVEA